jgi:hypothetical protein
MKTIKNLRILLLAGIMLAVSFNADAQFGNFGKKLKKIVMKSDLGIFPDFNKTFKASAEAKSADPKADDATAVSIIEGWMIDRDALGNILRRRLSAWVNIKDPETGKRVARNYGFAQQYEGGGKYGSTIFYGVGTLNGMLSQ